MSFPSCDMAQDKERELINSATEAARQLIDVIFGIIIVPQISYQVMLLALPLANTLPPGSANI